MNTTRLLPGPLKRLREHLREIRRGVGETRRGIGETQAMLAEAQAMLAEGHAMLAEARDVATRERAALDERMARLEELASDHRGRQEQLLRITRFVHDRAHSRRRELRRLRADPAYERAFQEPNPLISVVIPTYEHYELLRERSIPSVLGQTYQRFEVVVVGDAAPDEARQAVEEFGDPRLKFLNLQYRGPYPDDPVGAWLVSGVPAYNAGVAHATGLWIAPLDDDDAWRPRHLEGLLERARLDRAELAYSRLQVHFADGGGMEIGCFPPKEGQFGIQAAMYHAGLREIFEFELADAALGLPSDWALCLRMLEAGVRVGMLDEVTVDYYPSRSWRQRWEGDRLHPWTDADDGSDAQGVIAGQRPEWEYVPEGWLRASDPGEPSATGWRAADVARSYREKWPQFLAAVGGAEPLGVNHEVPDGMVVGRDDILDQNAILAFAYAVTRAAHRARHRSGDAPLSVLDWGGALGHYQVLVHRLLPEAELDYHCRELPDVCAAGRELQPAVTFHETDQCLSRQYDLVIASNSLQYAEDWPQLLRRLAAAAAGWLFLTRVPLVLGHGSFVALQRVQGYGYGTEVLGWVFNRDELLGAAASADLTFEREFLLHPGWEIAGAPEAPRLGGFLFLAKAPT